MTVMSDHYRTLFISDVHLGTRASQAGELLEFLKHNDADTIYLVGDIVDFWNIRRNPYWPQEHNDVVQKLLRKARKGATIKFIPGNHDEALRDYCGMQFGAIEFMRNAEHVTADGRKFLVMHGDEFDVVVRNAKWLAFLGDIGYELALASNRPLNWVRRRMGLGYWSLSAYLKYRVKKAVNFIGTFEKTLSDEAERVGAEGIICGHIHHAAERQVGAITYLNTGDWVESCTAIAETQSGEMKILRWFDMQREMQADEKKAALQPVDVAA
ncbi:MAG: UDP-2,3-diacylglucosamine diphosphatase [Pseudomonadota bacterium]